MLNFREGTISNPQKWSAFQAWDFDLGSSWRNVSALLRMDISHIGSLHAQRCMERVEDPAQKEGKLQRADAKDVCFIVIVDGFGILDFGMYTLLVLFYTSTYAC